MRLSLSYFVILLASLLGFGCRRASLVNKATLLSYIHEKEHGLIQENNSAGIVYSLRYKPRDLVMLQDLQCDPNSNRDSLKAMYSDCLYFVLSISQDSTEIFGRLREDYASLLKKISFGLNEQVRLVSSAQK